MEAAGLRHLQGRLSRKEQEELLAAVLAGVEAAGGWFRPVMPRSGRPFSIVIANLGELGWISDLRGYRYTPLHPETGRRWAPIPAPLLGLWRELADYPDPPECCLVNLYRPGSRLGLHRDEDEETFEAPIVSVSLGDSAIFRIGGATRRAPSRRIELRSGDVLVMAGPSRLAYHGIDRILPGTGDLVPGGGRISLTLRRVRRSAGLQPPSRGSRP